MADLQKLLDQIDRLDQQATRSPWGIHQGDYYEVGPLEDDLGDVLVSYGIVEVADLPDAEFIALSRTALPALSRAVRAVLANLGQLEVKYDDYNAIDHIVHSITHELRQTITKVLGDGNV